MSLCYVRISKKLSALATHEALVQKFCTKRTSRHSKHSSFKFARTNHRSPWDDDLSPKNTLQLSDSLALAMRSVHSLDSDQDLLNPREIKISSGHCNTSHFLNWKSWTWNTFYFLYMMRFKCEKRIVSASYEKRHISLQFLVQTTLILWRRATHCCSRISEDGSVPTALQPPHHGATPTSSYTPSSLTRRAPVRGARLILSYLCRTL